MRHSAPPHGGVISLPTTSSSKVIVIVVAILVIIVIVLGVGLGVGLSRKDDGSSSSGTASGNSSGSSGSQYTDEGSDTGDFSVLSAPTVNCTYGVSSTCGCSATKPSFLSPRIVHGYTAVTNSWPWMVAIFINNDRAFCGGFLVTYQHVITAAHCVKDITASTIKVYAGIQKLSARDSGQSRAVSKVNVHPNYESSTSFNDIAVLTLQSAFSETSTIGKCCLTFNTSLPSGGEHAVITGWGVTSFNSSKQPNNLLQGVVQIQNSSSLCPLTGNNTRFCAIYRGTGSCFGDSGGPLMTSVNNAWTCTGVVSSGLVVNGTSCGNIGIYTKVSAYQSYINGIING